MSLDRAKEDLSYCGRCLAVISCIIVSYWPDNPHLFHLCSTVVADGASVVLVDNTEVPYLCHERLLITVGYTTPELRMRRTWVYGQCLPPMQRPYFFDRDSNVEP